MRRLEATMQKMSHQLLYRVRKIETKQVAGKVDISKSYIKFFRLKLNLLLKMVLTTLLVCTIF